MKKPRSMDPIDTIYGRFIQASKRRLDLTYDYEAAEIQAFRRIAEEITPSIFLDIGANIGVYSIFLASIESIERIFVFEPAPDAYRLLQQNIALQDSTRFHPRNVALSDSAGMARFSIFGDLAGNNAIEATSVSAVRGSKETIEVPTARLDDEVTANGKTFMCKIDVEGHELPVLTGASEFLGNNTGVLQIESFANARELDALLGGYQYVRIFRVKHDYYYTNIADSTLQGAVVEILFDEVANALTALKDERRWRRRALRAARESIDILRFGTDPVTGARAPKSLRRARKNARKE